MTLQYLDEYRDPEISREILERIKTASRRKIRLMEVCGTHTVSIFRNGIRSLLPQTISLLSGPGCPVCVTAQNEIDAFVELSRRDDVIITTFGDLIRVPGADSSLQNEQAKGRDIRIVYSSYDALDIAKKNPDKYVVFLGIGFETTAPTIAASILAAQDLKLKNYFVMSAHKLLPPALFALAEHREINIDGLILPGHVSVVIGVRAYVPFFNKYKIPCVVTGFEPVDILQAIHRLVLQIENNAPGLENAYKRAVSFEGNPKARSIMDTVFESTDAAWRGIGAIPLSGLKIREEFEAFDAQKVFGVHPAEKEEPKGCACGEIITGLKIPPQCALYSKKCTPLHPVGPCMVSSEGTCAAYYRYHVQKPEDSRSGVAKDLQ
jgi:hydrogenase expression/formation protein HypD